MKFTELTNIELAIPFLADHLIKGTLVLFLGAGSSKGFGLPNWLEFTNRFRTSVGLNEMTGANTPEEIQHAMDEALDRIPGAQDRINTTRSILYPDPDTLDVSWAFQNHLLISISSLLMGSKRGHIRRVVTLNYDSMLEWFLSLFGFQVNAIADLPAMEGSEDVRIYHPHGFVPHPSLKFRDSKSLILGLKDANNMVGGRENLWREKERQIMESGVCLFVGLSGNTLSDRSISPILSTVGDHFKEMRPLGIWIVKDDLTEVKKSEFLRNNIAPIQILGDQEISKFILRISQTALERNSR